MDKSLKQTVIIPDHLAGKRLDQALAQLLPEHSRARLQGWIKAGDIHIDQQPASQRLRVRGGETVEISADYQVENHATAENIPLNILYQDKHLLVLNKPPGLVVHPGAGNPEHTLLNALLHHDPSLQAVPRAGIIQRLDKDTSGIMVVARTPESHTFLVSEMQARHIRREYQAIVSGVMTAGGTVDQPLGRHRHKRTQMAVTASGKPAITHYRIIRKFRAHTHVRIQLETGRTHQIRVHMAWLKYPIVGDPVYGGRAHLPKQASAQLIQALRSFPRQALHACALELQHPATAEPLAFEAPLPADMQHLLAVLDHDTHNTN